MQILWNLFISLKCLLDNTMKENTSVPTVHEEYSITSFA